MNDYLPKPIDESILFDCLSKWLPATEETTDYMALDHNNNNNTPEVINKNSITIWKRADLEKHLGLNDVLIKKIILSFLQSMPELINQLEQQIKTQQIAELTLTIHSIKGVAASISATELYGLCTNIETLIQKNMNKEIIDAWPEFKRGYQRLRQVLKNEIV